MASVFIHDPEGFEAPGAGFPNSGFNLTLGPLGRIIGVIGLLLVLCACLWAIAEYAEQKAQIRRAETERYIQAFETGPVADAWAKLRQTGTAPDIRTYGLRAEPLEAELEAELEMVLGYFRGFALCVRAGNCDPERARMYLGERPADFLDTHRAQLEANFDGVPLDRDLQVLLPPEEPATHIWP